MTQPLALLLRSLQRAGLDIDAEGALDSLWLACEIRDRERAGAPRHRRPSREVVAPDHSTTLASRTEDGAKRASTETPRRDSLSVRTAEFAMPAAPSSANAAAPARTVTLARAAALPGSRELIKGLRPLRRRVVSPGAGVLDVDATVRRAAEEDLWFPSFASSRERWLDVMLVADHGLSMIFWKDTIDEFERVLRNSGAFRSVRSWWMESDADAPAITARGRGPVPATPDGLARLTRGVGRSVVFVVSDCVGPRWHDGAIPCLVGGWSRILPVALMQVTPEWFWARTSLGDTVGSRFRSAVPAAINHRFQWDATALGAGGVPTEEEQTLLRMPTATLTGDALARLSGLIAGVGREWAPGVVFDLTWSPDDEPAPGPPPSAEARVARFRALASTAALRLAAAFAASPVRTLGVLRLLRRDLLPDASPFAEAEVMLGGIVRVKRDEARWDLGASVPLEFPPGVQQLLLDGAVAGDVLRVLRHAAAVAETGVGPTFTSWLENPSSGAGQLDSAESDFAAAVVPVLHRLGGAYAQMVKTVSPPVHEHPMAVDKSPPSGADAGRTTSVGQPHSLSYPSVLYGRDDAVHQLDRWFLDWSDRRPVSITGSQGIGKTALAAHAVVRWRNTWSGDEPFVWCFQVEPWSRSMLRQLREYYTGAPTFEGAETLETEVLDAVSQRRNSLVILDGLDAIEDGFEVERVLGIAAKMAEAGVHVLVTGRTIRSDLISLNELTLTELDDEASEALVSALLAAPRAPLLSEPDRDMVSRVIRDRSHGNPLVLRTLIGHVPMVPADILFRELNWTSDGSSRIEPDRLRQVAAQLARASQAWKLWAMGTTSFDAGDLESARRAFDGVVELRSDSPSKFLKGRVLLERGRTSSARSDFTAAATDLADAAGLFREVSAQPELVLALEALAQARMATSRDDEAIELLREAANVAREGGDRAGTGRVLLHLATLQTRQGAVNEALVCLHGAADALAAAGDRPLLAEALNDLATLYESTGNYAGAKISLKGFRDIRPDQSASVAERLERLAHLEETQNSQALNQTTTAPSGALEGDDDRVMTVEFLISGRVQGVGFRFFAQQCFQEIGLESGEAEHLPDGRIRVRATGPRSRLKQLQERVRRGPTLANVERVITTILNDEALRQSSETTGFRPGAVTMHRASTAALRRAVVAIGVGRTHDQLPDLPVAANAARRFAEWALSSQQIPRNQVVLLTDQSGPVTTQRILDATTRNVELSPLDQLIIYFAGYSASVTHADYWLTAQSPGDLSGPASVDRIKELARHSGIPHVVFVSDTCPVSPIHARTALGEAPLPNRSTSIPAVVDHFSATPLSHPSRETFVVGDPSRESSDVTDAPRRYQAAYTTVLLSALNGDEPSVQDERDDVRFVRPRALVPYLEKAVSNYLRSVGAPFDPQYEPEARIESGPDAWLARFE